MRAAAWKISTFVAAAAAVYFAVHPLGKTGTSSHPGAKEHEAAGSHGGVWGWLSSSSGDTAPAHTGTHLQALRDARNPTEECEALAVLGEEGASDGEAVAEITDRTAASQPRNIRICAVRALEHVPTASARSYLTTLIDDEDTSVREWAMRALAGKARDDTEARDALVAAAHSEDRDVRLAALVALGDAHVPEASALIRDAVAHETGDMQVRLIAALGATHDPNAVASIKALLDDGPQSTREAALEALGAIGDPVALGVLQDKLDHGTRSDVAAAAEALAASGDANARKTLIDATQSTRRDEQVAALRALAHVDGEGVRDAMTKGLQTGDPQIVNVASSWFSQHGDKAAVPELASLLKTAPSQSHTSIMSALSGIGGEEARTALAAIARTPGPDQGSALNYLVGMPGGRDDGRKLALQMIKEGGQDVSTAVNVLSQDGSPEAREALVSVARGGGQSSAYAINALGEQGDAASMRALGDLARSGGTPRLRGQALAAIGATGDPKNASMLLGAASDKTPEVRRAALMALGRLGGDPSAERAIVAATSDSDVSIRDTAVRALASLHSPTANGQLEKLASSTDASVARLAFQSLVTKAPDRAAVVADGAMSSGGAEMRQAIVSSARELSPEAGKRILLAGLRDTDGDVARSAIDGLEAMGGTEAQQALLDVLSSNASDDVKRAAANSLDASGTELAKNHSGLIERYKSPASDDQVDVDGRGEEDED